MVIVLTNPGRDPQDEANATTTCGLDVYATIGRELIDIAKTSEIIRATMRLERTKNLQGIGVS